MTKQTIFRKILLVSSLILLTLFSSCKKKNQNYLSFKIAVTPNKVVNPLIQIAEEKGYFEEYNFKPEYVTLEMIGTPEALISGKLDAAYQQVIPPLSYGSQGADVTFFAGTLSGGMETLCRKEDAASLRDLTNWKGKTIGVIQLSTSEMIVKSALKSKYGYESGKDIKFKLIDSYPAIETAVKKGIIDIGFVTSEYLEAALSLGLEHLFPLTHLEKDYVCCRQYAYAPTFAKTKEAYKAYLKGQIRAYKDYTLNPEETIRSLARLTHEDEDYIQRFIYDRSTNGDRTYNPDPNYNGTLAIYNVLASWKYIEDTVKLQDFFNIEIYASALKEIVTQFPEDKFYKDMWTYFLENNNQHPEFNYSAI